MRAASPRSMFVVAALGLTLILAMVLALMAQASAAYHRNTAEGVLRDYAAFAAEQYAGRAQQRLAYAVYPALNLLTQTGTGRPNGRLPEAKSLAAADQQARASLGTAAALFRLPLAGGFAALTGDTSSRLRRWVSDTVRTHALGAYARDWYLAMVWGGTAYDGAVLAYTLSRDSAGRPEVAAEPDGGFLRHPVHGRPQHQHERGSRTPLVAHPLGAPARGHPRRAAGPDRGPPGRGRAHLGEPPVQGA